VSAVVERRSWTPQPVFGLVGSVGGIGREDLETTLNMGVGMVAVVASLDVDAALGLLGEAGIPAWVCGEVDARPGGVVEMAGDYA
jgi:phosphoribosylformylglycinamidine cyclo-ligase